MGNSDIEFLVKQGSIEKVTDVFGKPCNTINTKIVTAWYQNRVHRSITVKGRQVITDDGTVVHDQGTHGQAVAAAKRYLAKQFTRNQ